jgi:hypothetical protein
MPARNPTAYLEGPVRTFQRRQPSPHLGQSFFAKLVGTPGDNVPGTIDNLLAHSLIFDGGSDVA